jgi:histidinol-phosphatase (PHP family)
MCYSCLHTHTTFCDGEDDIETFCRVAYEKGLVDLGFSAHAPIRKKTGWDSDWNLPDERLPEYLDAVREARHRWAGKLRVFVGLEIDFIAGLMGPADSDYRELGLDYCIGSVHYLIPPRGKPFEVDGAPDAFAGGVKEGFSGDIEAVINAYWDAEEALIRAGGFDILGHLDLIKKNNLDERWFSYETNAYRTRLTRVADCIAAQMRASAMRTSQTRTSKAYTEPRLPRTRAPPFVVEVNTGGLNRGKTRETYPSLSLLRLLQERSVPVIITADAHRAEHVDGHYALAQETLSKIGYKINHFSLASFNI